MAVPDEAWDVVVKACPIKDVVAAKGSAWDINDLQQKAVEAAAPLIVAAELERLAVEESVNVNEGGYQWRAVSTEDLYMRAAELRGES